MPLSISCHHHCGTQACVKPGFDVDPFIAYYPRPFKINTKIALSVLDHPEIRLSASTTVIRPVRAVIKFVELTAHVFLYFVMNRVHGLFAKYISTDARL